MACTQPSHSNRRTLPVNSAFFPNAGRQEQKNGSLPGHPKENNGVVIQPFHFPPTKQIWWDRKPQGSPEVLHLASRRNLRLLVNEKTIRLAIKHFKQSSSPFACFLIGSISIDSREEAVDINVDRFDPGRDLIEKKGVVKRKVPTTVVPGDQIIPLTLIKGLSGAENSTTHSKMEFQRTLEILHSRISGQDAVNMSNFLSLKANCHAHVDDDEIILNLHFGAVSIATNIVAVPVSPVPIIPTALARNLTGPLRLSDVQGTPKCGFLTMDHTRKLLLLLESDPKAYSLPLIGVWVSGPFTIHHPYIWSCCVRFLHCAAIKERVLASPNTFLLVHYSPAQTNPIFWECSPQVQLDEGLFELYSSYENLHLDEISSPKYTEPLCFDLVPAGDTVNRSVFSQAVSSWTKDNHNHKNENPSERKVIIDNNSGSLEPRPSPSPHPQMTRSPLLMPSIPEVSLSLSFDESSYSGQNQDLDSQNQNGRIFSKGKQQILPGKDSRRILPQKKDDQAILKRNAKTQDQENRVDPRHASKQMLVQRTPGDSPQREPLRPITGQTNNMQGPPVLEPRTENLMPDHKCLMVANSQGWLQSRAINGGHSKASGNVPKSKGLPKKVQRDVAMNGRGRGFRGNQRENERTGRKELEHSNDVKEIQDAETQGKMGMTRTSCTEPRIPLVIVEDQNYQKNDRGAEENVQGKGGNAINPEEYVRSAKKASVHNIDSNGHCLLYTDGDVSDDDITAVKMTGINHAGELHHVESSNGIKDKEQELGIDTSQRHQLQDARPFHQHQPSNDSINRKHNDSGMDDSVFCDSGVGDSTRDESHPEEGNEGSLEGSFSDSPSKEDTSSSNEKKDAANGTRPDPYDLIMRQEQQLKELQQQINLLLLQQSLTQNSPVGIPTPPPTPVSSDKSCSFSSPVRPRDIMVTMGTNTGASLLMGSPVVRHGMISVGTSPMRETVKNERRTRSQRNSPSTTSKSNPMPTTSNQTFKPHPPDATLPTESKSSSRQSLDGTTDDDELDEKGLVIERLDDTTLTLASSIHGVDICEFVGSPESNGGQRRSDDSSPVLGESASMILQERHQQEQRETETPEEEDHRFESLLYKNERLFYDNLLSKVNQLLCEKVGKSEEPPDPSHDATQGDQPKESEENVIHEPSRQEVWMATVKELERIKESKAADVPDKTKQTTAKEIQRHNEALFRSSFLGVMADHPRINYISMSVDETLDEAVINTDSLALKYLTNEQLQEYHQLVSHCHGNGGRGPSRAHTNTVSFNNGRVVNDVDCTWNNLSMATQDYLQRYNLAARKKAHSTRDEESHVSGTQVPGQSREGSVASIRCSAPPSTPEPKQTETRILDIQRLRNLPKLL